MRTSLLKRLATVATALGLTSAGLLGAGASPAQAAISDCPSGYFCAWKTENGTGAMYKTSVNTTTLGTWDNTFRSVVNRTSKWACLYDDPNYGDEPGGSALPSDPAGTEWGGPGSNSVSSLKFVPTERECVLPAYPEWHAYTAPKAAGFGDMNADRKSDVIVRDKAGRLWFLPGDFSGRLIGTGGWNAMSAIVRHGDFTGDAREDLIAREAATGKLWLYPGTGTGGVGARKLIGSGGWNAMTKITAFGDLTADGRSDLLAVEASTGKLWLYPGTSTGTLGARKLIGSGWNAMNTLVAPGDMNGNGRADLIAREPATGKLWLYPATGTGTFGARVLIGSGWNVMASFLAVGDFNASGTNDLATITTSSYEGEGCRGVGCLVLYGGKGTGGLNAGLPEAANWSSLNGAF
ncbi:FG-GAP-like repeat-containing protein [Streptomyces sp. NBC_00094]|uniref:FG-GAP-like repeat-containing protein n=1 Tax=Streptomyces sp. NBC_00094 TaxID=2903620 RepID=UPI00224DA74B|nr:FG-GAP-like repeat-containing protein [Streptomyces sp. NBC_00094]MCX5392396.1 peptidase inhibitor family I36 protein [Streptomyces sp. NBC_00094]